MEGLRNIANRHSPPINENDIIVVTPLCYSTSMTFFLLCNKKIIYLVFFVHVIKVN